MRPVFDPHPKGPTKPPERERMGRPWRRLRRLWLMRHPTCARCGLAGEEVHHVVPRATAPERTLDPSNLETLCRSCHAAAHGRDLSTSYPHRYRRSRGGVGF